MINIKKYSDDLVEKDGIFFAKKETEISYPKSGNETCFQIEENSFWFYHRNNCIKEAVKKYCPNNLFFDIGGGNGFVARGLEDNGIPTVLIEPGLQGCLNAKKRNLKNIVCSTLENASFKKNTIPSIGLFDVVEHIENDVDFLTSIHTFLKENGFVFIAVPAFNALWSNEDDDAGHFRRYTLKELDDKLKTIGFVVEYSTYIFSVLPAAIFLFRTLPSKLGFNKHSNSLDKNIIEHKRKKGIFDKVLNWIWEFEINKIRKGSKILIGGSCFVVARKNTG
ncbi:MAG: methyltransferase domain-containing protein [Bacteroidota bacterium]